MKITRYTVATLIILSAFFSACTVKDDMNNTGSSSSLAIKLASDPAPYSRVNVDIRTVMVNLSGDASNGWIPLNTHAGVYDLLDLQNGKDTLLAKGTLSGPTLKQLRFVLGINNTIEIGNLTYPLMIPVGAASGLQISLSKDLRSAMETVVIDFDANASITLEPNGTYSLRPVLAVRVK